MTLSRRTKAIACTFILSFSQFGFSLPTRADVRFLNRNSSDSPRKATKPDGDIYVLAIGINEYPGLPKLNFCEADALGFADALEKSGEGLFKQVHSYKITNKSATRSSIESAVDEISRSSKPEDVFVLYFAGFPAFDDTGRYALRLVDTPQEKTASPSEGLRPISATQLGVWSTSIPARQQLMLIDVNDSASAMNEFSKQVMGQTSLERQLIGRSIALLGVSGESREFAELQHGEVSYRAIQAINGAADLNRDGLVSSSEFVLYVQTFFLTNVLTLNAKKQDRDSGSDTCIFEKQIGREFVLGKAQPEISNGTDDLSLDTSITLLNRMGDLFNQTGDFDGTLNFYLSAYRLSLAKGRSLFDNKSWERISKLIIQPSVEPERWSGKLNDVVGPIVVEQHTDAWLETLMKLIRGYIEEDRPSAALAICQKVLGPHLEAVASDQKQLSKENHVPLLSSNDINTLARVYCSAGEFHDLIALLNASNGLVSMKPEQSQKIPNNILTTIALLQGAYQQAKKHCEELPAGRFTTLLRATIFASLSDSKRCEQLLDRARNELRFRTDRETLAWLYATSGKPERGIDVTNNAVLRQTLQACESMSHKQSISDLKLLESAVKQSSNNFERAISNQTLGRFHLLSKNTKECKTDLEQAANAWEKMLDGTRQFSFHGTLEEIVLDFNIELSGFTNSLLMLSEIYASANQQSESEKVLQRILSKLQDLHVPNHALGADVYAKLASLYKSNGQIERTEECLQKGVAIRSFALGAEHFLTQDLADQLATLRLENLSPVERSALTRMAGMQKTSLSGGSLNKFDTQEDTNGLERGSRLLTPHLSNTSPSISGSIGTNYAVFFATDLYGDQFPKLSNPISDARALAQELEENYRWSVQVIENPSRDKIWLTLRDYAQKSYGQNDQLMIFFAGHGLFDPVVKGGYIVASDSKKQDLSRSTYVPFANLKLTVDNLNCPHVLLSLDVCFGGSFLEEIAKGVNTHIRSDETDQNLSLATQLNKKMPLVARKLLSSGSNEPVFDGAPGTHSPFVSKLLESLQTHGGKDGYLTFANLVSALEKTPPGPLAADFGESKAGSAIFFIPVKNKRTE